MKAMVLAAGLGTRLHPLTDSRPKALVEIGGRTLLEIALTRLQKFGIYEVIVNAHHFADTLADYLKAKANFGMRVEISREDVLLDTGGGLKKVGWFFREGGAGSEEPFLLHNVDVLSTIDFERMVQTHRARGALATLAVQERETSRPLLFDEELKFRGRAARRENAGDVAAAGTRSFAFTGIHVISPRLLSLMIEDGIFSIIDVYVRLAGQGERIQGFRANEYYWRDLGRPEQVQQAEADFKQGLLG